MSIQEYADKHYTPREQADAAWAVANNIFAAMVKAERLAKSCKTEAGRTRNAFNAIAYRHNYEAQMVRAGILEGYALSDEYSRR